MINDDKQMADLPPEKQALRALQHVASRIHSAPFVGYYLGYGTQAFAIVTEAIATLKGEDVVKVRTDFAPTNPRDPRYEPRGDEPPRLEFSDETIREIRAASSILEDLATADEFAAATNRHHRTFDLLISARRKASAAAHLAKLIADLDRACTASAPKGSKP